MEVSGSGKTPNSSLSFRYNAGNEELEELYNAAEDDSSISPQINPSPSNLSENASPKKTEKNSSIIDKYFKSMKEKEKGEDSKVTEDVKTTPQKEVTASPVKDYLTRLSKRNNVDVTPEGKESNETWKIFHDFKFKIAQAVEDMKTRSAEETKEKSVPRDNSTSDSEENSAIKDLDQQSVGDTDNQVSSLDSSIQNLSEISQPVTAKANRDSSLPIQRSNKNSESDDTQKNYGNNFDFNQDLNDDSSLMDVESGVEALEDINIDNLADITLPDGAELPKDTRQSYQIQTAATSISFGFHPPPNKNNTNLPQKAESKTYFFNFSMYLLTFLLIVSYMLFTDSHNWNGFLLGLWSFCFASNLKEWVIDTYFTEREDRHFQLKKSSMMPSTYTIPSVKEYAPLKKFDGWINHYRYPEYDPFTYHINKTTTSFMKLEGCNLRISYTTTKIAKRALWDEKIENVTFYQHRLYNLTGAKVLLLPKGLVKRRQWSKKYPICIVLNEKEKIQVLERESGIADKSLPNSETRKSQTQEFESTETNTSPEKKKKFVWRRREKSISHSEGETFKEGLRQRLVKKMHRDKKVDNTTSEPIESVSKPQEDDAVFQDAEVDKTTVKDDVNADDDIDDTELSKIKEFLEDAESETSPETPVEGEWSVHIRPSTDRHSHLYLFARTGREKHEWYRRLANSIAEANASAETSVAEDKTAPSETTSEQDEAEMALFKVADREAVSYAKSTGKSEESVTIASSPSSRLDLECTEKTFWPYLFKIIQSKNSPVDCQCRLLPQEVTWVNIFLARLMYDVMRDSNTITRLQTKIQRKLNTLKLPSFMSPLQVTELSLRGSCPLVERVGAPSWDERGVWMDADLRYEGGAYITIQTKIDLLKLKSKNATLEEQMWYCEDNAPDKTVKTTASDTSEDILKKRKPAIYDSDVEDSAESSTDDESPPLQPVDSEDNIPVGEISSLNPESASSKNKFLRMVDKIATNKYFQQVTDYKYIKRAMEGLSNTDIKLQLDVKGLEGRLAINLPPPPHDRLWLGFRTNPQLVLKARPAFGARAVSFGHINNWIEQKLSKEFEKILVLPNMEDFMLDIMTPTPVESE